MLVAVALVGVGVVTFLAVAAGPLLLFDRRYELTAPTDAQRATLETYRVEAGLDIDRIAVRAADEADTAVAVYGPPRRRVLVVSTAVFDTLDTDVVIGLLAAAAGRVATGYAELRAVAVAVVVALFAAIATATVTFPAGFTALVASGLAALWAGRRVQYAADAHAADTVGATRVADAFAHMAARRGVEPETGGVQTWLEIQPPLGDRIEALRRRDG